MNVVWLFVQLNFLFFFLTQFGEALSMFVNNCDFVVLTFLIKTFIQLYFNL